MPPRPLGAKALALACPWWDIHALGCQLGSKHSRPPRDWGVGCGSHESCGRKLVGWLGAHAVERGFGAGKAVGAERRGVHTESREGSGRDIRQWRSGSLAIMAVARRRGSCCVYRLEILAEREDHLLLSCPFLGSLRRRQSEPLRYVGLGNSSQLLDCKPPRRNASPYSIPPPPSSEDCHHHQTEQVSPFEPYNGTQR